MVWVLCGAGSTSSGIRRSRPSRKKSRDRKASPMNQPAVHSLNVAPVRKSVRVNADRARAFEVFTAGLNRWWPRSHSIGGAPMEQAVIEPRVGGRWYERSADGSECEWGKVIAWDPPSRVVLGWQINAQFRYDPTVISEVEIRFAAEGDT